MPPTPEVVHGGQAWFLGQTGPVVRLHGVLAARRPAMGPGDRGGLLFALHERGKDWPIYSVGAEDIFERLEGRKVEVDAKIVDLSGGADEELWVATIMPVED